MPGANPTLKTTGSRFSYQIDRADPEKQATEVICPRRRELMLGDDQVHTLTLRAGCLLSEW